MSKSAPAGALGEDLAQGLVQLLLVDVQGPHLGPVGGMLAEVGGGLHGIGFLQGVQALQVQGVGRVVLGHEVDDEAGQLAALRPFGDPEVGPAAFLMTLQQAGFDQNLQMARDPGLALAQDFHQLAHRQVAMGAESQDSEARLLGHRPKTLQKLFHGKGVSSFAAFE